MKHVFFSTPERVQFILEALETKATIVEANCGSAKLTKVEVTIDDAIDALRLFHSGVSYGISLVNKNQ